MSLVLASLVALGAVSPREATLPVVSVTDVGATTLSVTARLAPNPRHTPSVGVIAEEVGASEPWLATLWQASFAATQATRSKLLDHEFTLRVSGPTGQHAAGLGLAATLTALLRNKKLLPHTSVTGALNPDGSAAPIDDALLRLRIAAGGGLKRFGVPLGARQQLDETTGAVVDLLAEGKRLGVEVQELSDLDAAYRFLTGDTLPRTTAATEQQMELWPAELTAINALTTKVRAEFEAEFPQSPEPRRAALERARRAAEDFAKSGDTVRALVVWSATLTALRLAVSDAQLQRDLGTLDTDGVLAALEKQEQALASQRAALRARIDAQFPNTTRANDVYAMDLLESVVTQGWSLRADATRKALREASSEDFERLARQHAEDLLRAKEELENGQRFLDLFASLPPLKKKVRSIDAARLAPWYVSAGAAARASLQARVKDRAFERDSTWHDVVGYGELLTTETDARARVVLAARQTIYSGYLANLHGAFGVQLDERGGFTVRNTRALAAQLDLSKARALQACGQALKDTGSIPFPARMRFLNARAAREGSDRQKTDALADLWIAHWWCEFAVRDQR